MGAGHGIGVKRNDYHRRNRRRNISMHKHSSGYGTERRAPAVRVIKGGGTLTRQHVEEINAREESVFHSHDERDDYNERDEIPVFFESLSSLEQSRFMYLPPFLKAEQIKRRRFGANANDRWWDWEEELGLNSDAGRPIEPDLIDMKQPRMR